MTEKIDYKKWHSGPPPSLGWWPASLSRDSTCLRWWNGSHWSKACWNDECEKTAASKATRKSIDEGLVIEWQHRPASWPARSRT